MELSPPQSRKRKTGEENEEGTLLSRKPFRATAVAKSTNLEADYTRVCLGGHKEDMQELFAHFMDTLLSRRQIIPILALDKLNIKFLNPKAKELLFEAVNVELSTSLDRLCDQMQGFFVAYPGEMKKDYFSLLPPEIKQMVGQYVYPETEIITFEDGSFMTIEEALARIIILVLVSPFEITIRLTLTPDDGNKDKGINIHIRLSDISENGDCIFMIDFEDADITYEDAIKYAAFYPTLNRLLDNIFRREEKYENEGEYKSRGDVFYRVDMKMLFSILLYELHKNYDSFRLFEEGIKYLASSLGTGTRDISALGTNPQKVLSTPVFQNLLEDSGRLIKEGCKNFAEEFLDPETGNIPIKESPRTQKKNVVYFP